MGAGQLANLLDGFRPAARVAAHACLEAAFARQVHLPSTCYEPVLRLRSCCTTGGLPPPPLRRAPRWWQEGAAPRECRPATKPERTTMPQPCPAVSPRPGPSRRFLLARR